MSDYRYGKPKVLKIDWEIVKKYAPPNQIDEKGNEIPWGDDPATRAYLINYAYNARDEERCQKEQAKKREEELNDSTKGERGKRTKQT